jgi:hypothetical protein
MTEMAPEGAHRERSQPAEVLDPALRDPLREGEVDEVVAPVPPGSDPADYDPRSTTEFL